MSKCEKCGEEMYQDCFGRPRCENCDPPCPGCFDGGGPGGDDDNDDLPGENTYQDDEPFHSDTEGCL